MHRGYLGGGGEGGIDQKQWKASIKMTWTARSSKELKELKARTDNEKAVIYKTSSHLRTVCDY